MAAVVPRPPNRLSRRCQLWVLARRRRMRACRRRRRAVVRDDVQKTLRAASHVHVAAGRVLLDRRQFLAGGIDDIDHVHVAVGGVCAARTGREDHQVTVHGAGGLHDAARCRWSCVTPLAGVAVGKPFDLPLEVQVAMGQLRTLKATTVLRLHPIAGRARRAGVDAVVGKDRAVLRAGALRVGRNAVDVAIGGCTVSSHGLNALPARPPLCGAVSVAVFATEQQAERQDRERCSSWIGIIVNCLHPRSHPALNSAYRIDVEVTCGSASPAPI